MKFFPLSGDRYHKNKTEQKPFWDKSIVDWFYKEAEKITYKKLTSGEVLLSKKVKLKYDNVVINHVDIKELYVMMHVFYKGKRWNGDQEW